MTKKEIISDLKWVMKNIENIRKEGERRANDSAYAFSFGMLTAFVQQLSREIPITREAVFKSEEQN